ncbi:unnamed protein product [Oncorhynchus mykiss]|uniref:Uncharacterized protein n=1 Tax=Oncorhynchus mykiss TaxID=8022 RepID=A0A060VTG7_ONCMY|nr:unnamed protein product [Oncorhynchus mykiss]
MLSLVLSNTEFQVPGMAFPLGGHSRGGPVLTVSPPTFFPLLISLSLLPIAYTAPCSSCFPLKSLSEKLLIASSFCLFVSRADAVADVRKQGAKALMKAHCRVKAWDKCFFSLRCFDHSLHHFKVSSKTDPEAIRKRWLDALEEHTAYSSCNTTQEQTTEDEEGDGATLGDLTDSLQAAEACQQKLETQVSIFLSMVKNEENNTLATPLLLKARETSDLSRETSSALHFCLSLFSKQQEPQVMTYCRLLLGKSVVLSDCCLLVSSSWG